MSSDRTYSDNLGHHGYPANHPGNPAFPVRDDGGPGLVPISFRGRAANVLPDGSSIPERARANVP